MDHIKKIGDLFRFYLPFVPSPWEVWDFVKAGVKCASDYFWESYRMFVQFYAETLLAVLPILLGYSFILFSFECYKFMYQMLEWGLN